jgi:serine/threonine-protein kinase
VIVQVPAADQPLQKGSAIILTISEGTEYVFIPNVLSLKGAEAKKLLSDLGLIVETKTIGKRESKVVTNVSPKVGDRVKRGTTVTITLS